MDELFSPVVREDLEYHELDDGGVVCDAAEDRVHVLNLAAAYVWNCLDGTHSVVEIASELHRQANVPMERAVGDVGDAIALFRAENLLRSP
jgi:hypothetical protein